MGDTTSTPHAGLIGTFLSRLKYPQLFFLMAALFVADVFIPDMIPLADELLLGGMTILLGMLRDKRRAPRDLGKEPEKNVTPPR